MTNHFFVHTALQLTIAQYIVYKDFTKGINIIHFGDTGSNNLGLNKTLTEICDPKLWHEIRWIGDLNGYIPNFSHFECWLNAKSFLSSFENIPHSSFFFGDIGHVGYLNFALYFESHGGSIHFFEEGLSHYSGKVLEKRKGNSLILILKQWLHYIGSQALFGTSGIGSYIYNTSTTKLNLKIKRRYNLLNRPDWEVFDRKIDFSDVFPNLNDTLSENILGYDKTILFLSSTIRNLSPNPVELDALVIDSLISEGDIKIIYKFHPKDSDDFRKELIERYSPDFTCLEFLSYDGPVENLFGDLGFNGIISYGSSAHLYWLSSQESNKDCYSYHVFEFINKTTAKSAKKYSFLEKFYNRWMGLVQKFGLHG